MKVTDISQSPLRARYYKGKSVLKDGTYRFKFANPVIRLWVDVLPVGNHWQVTYHRIYSQGIKQVYSSLVSDLVDLVDYEIAVIFS